MNFFLKSANFPRAPKHERVSFPISTENRGGGQGKRGRKEGRKEGNEPSNDPKSASIAALSEPSWSLESGDEAGAMPLKKRTWLRYPPPGEIRQGVTVKEGQRWRAGRGRESVSAISFSGEKTRPNKARRGNGTNR